MTSARFASFFTAPEAGLVADFLAAVVFFAATFLVAAFFTTAFFAAFFGAAGLAAFLATAGLAAFFGAAFFTDFLATELLTEVFLAGAFLAAGFLTADFLAADFLAADFLAAGFLAADFLAADFLAAGFLAAGFLAAAFFDGLVFFADMTGLDRCRSGGVYRTRKCVADVTRAGGLSAGGFPHQEQNQQIVKIFYRVGTIERLEITRPPTKLRSSCSSVPSSKLSSLHPRILCQARKLPG
ncbi:MAG: hypothetical protein ACO3RV_07320 [Luteolibacter sp.]